MERIRSLLPLSQTHWEYQGEYWMQKCLRTHKCTCYDKYINTVLSAEVLDSGFYLVFSILLLCIWILSSFVGFEKYFEVDAAGCCGSVMDFFDFPNLLETTHSHQHLQTDQPFWSQPPFFISRLIVYYLRRWSPRTLWWCRIKSLLRANSGSKVDLGPVGKVLFGSVCALCEAIRQLRIRQLCIVSQCHLRLLMRCLW
jgi:hypothetical protein